MGASGLGLLSRRCAHALSASQQRHAGDMKLVGWPNPAPCHLPAFIPDAQEYVEDHRKRSLQFSEKIVLQIYICPCFWHPVIYILYYGFLDTGIYDVGGYSPFVFHSVI